MDIHNHSIVPTDTIIGQSLTEKEKQVLISLAEGQDVATIAKKLGNSINTVHQHRHNIGRKLGYTNIALMTRYAIRQGWVIP